MRKLKIVIGGAFNAGKTQFVTTISEIATVQTERRVTDETRLIKPFTTAALDFGRITMNKHLSLHLYGTPGQRRFDFMWAALARGMRGLVILVDSTRPATFAETRAILEFFRPYNVPTIVAANKQDRPGAVVLDQLRDVLQLPENTPLVACVAIDQASVYAVLQALLDLLPPELTLDVIEDTITPLAPVQPRPPAPLAAVAIRSRTTRHHLTRGDGRTLCGRSLGSDALPVIVFAEGDCRTCARRAGSLRLGCADCGRPLTHSRDGQYCLACAQRRAHAERDAHLLTFDMALP